MLQEVHEEILFAVIFQSQARWLKPVVIPGGKSIEVMNPAEVKRMIVEGRALWTKTDSAGAGVNPYVGAGKLIEKLIHRRVVGLKRT